jgi:mannose-6-phosphate isomerase-like protein (cupin superfamily)
MDREIAFEQWRRRVRRIGGAIQGVFAALWLGQGAYAAFGVRVAVAIGAAAGLLTLAGVFATRGTAPRPTGREAALIERAVTGATVEQLAASFVVPECARLAGRTELALPGIVLTVAVLLAFLGARLRSRALLIGGAALGGTDLAVALLVPVGAVVPSAGLVCGAVQLGIALQGFASLRRRNRLAPSAEARHAGDAKGAGLVAHGRHTHVRFVDMARDAGGTRVLCLEQTLDAHAPAPPLHAHPTQTERFTVQSGHLMVSAGREERELGPSDSIEIPPGTAHTLWNARNEPVVHSVEISPARDMAAFFETVVGLEAEGALPPYGRPHLRQLALLLHAHGVELRSLPRVLARPLVAMLAWLGRITGLQPSYERFRARPEEVSS